MRRKRVRPKLPAEKKEVRRIIRWAVHEELYGAADIAARTVQLHGYAGAAALLRQVAQL